MFCVEVIAHSFLFFLYKQVVICLEMVNVLGIVQAGIITRPLVRNESPTISTASTDTEFSELTIGKAPSQGGILKQSSARSDTIRIDCSGNVIVPGSKSHRVCFADELGGSPRPIAKVHQVESWKSWNFGNRFVDGGRSCICTMS